MSIFFVVEISDWRKILKVDGRDGSDPQNRENVPPAGRITCMLFPLCEYEVGLYKIAIGNCMPQLS